MVGELHLDLVEVAQRIVQDWLLSLPLALLLLLWLQCLLLLLLRCWWWWWLARREGHEHARLHLLSGRRGRLSRRLHGTAGEDVTRTAWRAEWHLRLRLAGVRKQAVRTVNSPLRSHGHWLMQRHGWARLCLMVRRRLF